MSGRWFRFYDEAVSDPKVQCLPPELFKFWVNMLCVSSKSGGSIPSIKHLSFSLRMQERRVKRLMEALIREGLIDNTEQGFEPHNWHGRQYKSDVSTDRVKRFRERHETVSATPSETEDREQIQKTDTEQKESERAARSGSRLPAGWMLSAEDVAFAEQLGLSVVETQASFCDYWHGVAGAKGRKADWSATWRNWCRREAANKTQRYVSKFAKPDAPLTSIADDVLWSARMRGYQPGGIWNYDWGPRPEDGGRDVPPRLLAMWTAKLKEAA